MAKTEKRVIERPDGGHDVIEGHQVNAAPLNRNEAQRLASAPKKILDLQTELRCIDGRIAEYVAQVDAAEKAAAALAAPALRGDVKAMQQLKGHESCAATAQKMQHRFQAARATVMGELVVWEAVQAQAATAVEAAAADQAVDAFIIKARELDAAGAVWRAALLAFESDVAALRNSGRVRQSALMTRNVMQRIHANLVAGSPNLRSPAGNPSDRMLSFEKAARGWARPVMLVPAPPELPPASELRVDDDRTVVTIKPVMPRAS